jgi:dihydroorotate dehydrogenase electron transfer subunit
MLRRAYSIAGFRGRPDSVEIDVIYRVVGKGTRWLQTLKQEEVFSLLGPLGNQFPLHPDKKQAWMVAGGVGLPPMLWLAQALSTHGKEAIAFCGAQSFDLLPLSLHGSVPPRLGMPRHPCYRLRNSTRLGCR